MEYQQLRKGVAVTFEELKQTPIGTLLWDIDFGIVKLEKHPEDADSGVYVYAYKLTKTNITWVGDLSLATSLQKELW